MLYFWKELPILSEKKTIYYKRDISPDRFLFLDGNELSADILAKTLYFDAEVEQRYLSSYYAIGNDTSFPVVKKCVAELLVSLAPKDVQVLKTEILCKDGILTDYVSINIATMADIFDRENSNFTTFPESTDVAHISYFACRPDGLNSHSLARDKSYFSHIVVAENIKQAFEKAKFKKGINFITPHDHYVSLYGNKRTSQ